MNFRPSSLQGRLLVTILALVAVQWLVTAAVTVLDVRHELEEVLDGHLVQTAAMLINNEEHEAEEGDVQSGAKVLNRYGPRVAAQVFSEGRLSLRTSNAPSVPMLVQALWPVGPGFASAQFDGSYWRVHTQTSDSGKVRAFVAERLDSRTEILWAVLRSSFVPTLLAVPGLVFIIWWSVRRTMRPLRSLSRTLALRDAHDTDAVIVTDVPAEMRPMLDALNGLLVRITALMASERRFTADAAHELRTPIAVIRTQAQVALAAPADASRAEALNATLAGCDRATRLVEQLLMLSRLESGAPIPREPMDLATILREQVSELAIKAVQKDQTIEVHAPDNCLLYGNAALLSSLVRNLIDNAVRYSPPGATIQATLVCAADRLRLQVEDSGPGISESDLARVGERFFRVLGTGQAGSGLGWSIVRRITDAHDGVVRIARTARLGGLDVVVELPRLDH